MEGRKLMGGSRGGLRRGRSEEVGWSVGERGRSGEGKRGRFGARDGRNGSMSSDGSAAESKKTNVSFQYTLRRLLD